MTDEQVLNEARAGDPAAMGSLLSEVQPQIYRFAMRMCRHPQDAEDVLQETLLAVVKNLSSYRAESRFSTWVYTIARSFCIKKHRRKIGAPEPETLSDEPLARVSAPHPDQHQTLETKQAWESVARGLEQLPEENREVLVLRDVEGLSAEEASSVLGLSVPATKSRLHRARKALRAQLGQTESGPTCPDIVTAFSRNLEEQLSPRSCAELERHIAGCPSCRGICDALQRDLRICQSAPVEEVPSDVQARIRAAIEQLPQPVTVDGS